MLPDFADPGMQGGERRPGDADAFPYTGWLRAQKLIPAANLRPGQNDVIVIGGPGNRERSDPRDTNATEIPVGQTRLPARSEIVARRANPGRLHAVGNHARGRDHRHHPRRGGGRLGGSPDVAKDMRVRADIQAISTQLKLYESVNGFVPGERAGLAGPRCPTRRGAPVRPGGISSSGSFPGSVGE